MITGGLYFEIHLVYTYRGYQSTQTTLRHARPCYGKSSFQSAGLQVQLGRIRAVVGVPSGPISSAATTTMFPWRLSVETEKKNYSPQSK